VEEHVGQDHSDQKMLVVLAHPDDESFGMGGTLAHYAARGVEIHLICATRGEVGEVGPEHMRGYDSIAELREAELICAAGQLGLKKVHFLDYRDSGMPGSSDNDHPRALAGADLDQVAGKISGFIRELRPDVVVTFDPIGGYRHPDHIFIHRAATEAFQLAGNPEAPVDGEPYQAAKLYYHTISKRFLRFVVRLLRLLGKDPSRWGKNQDIDLTELAETTFPVHARIRYGHVVDRKEAAAACHASQSGSALIGGFFGWLFKVLGFRDRDLFMRAYPEPEAGVVEEDLFAGLA
jgi:LmbE family N-acetylglucosaminyl deacetylase